jgi:hypothetical protein
VEADEGVVSGGNLRGLLVVENIDNSLNPTVPCDTNTRILAGVLQ